MKYPKNHSMFEQLNGVNKELHYIVIGLRDVYYRLIDFSDRIEDSKLSDELKEISGGIITELEGIDPDIYY
ncbi:hypothetical protein [Alkalihalobacillus sp. BA299]|uniref:hypothetical protein n=1 Tax=Alkalihalobacillus sp. BA299 TaxID=2815938 RepID=UPI001ADD4B0C|nr:hypothetical protein [Alkalihalobacillus sp. BA299]